MIKTKDAPWSMNALCVCSLVQDHVSLMLIDYVIDSVCPHIAHLYFSAYKQHSNYKHYNVELLHNQSTST